MVFLCTASITFADTLIFAQISDVHIPASPNQPLLQRDFSKSESNLRQAVRSINGNKNIQYVFFTGDLVDKSYPQLYEKFFSITNYLNKPYYVCLGNHDSNSPNGLNKTESLKVIQKLSRYHQYYPNYCVELNKEFLAIMVDGSNDYLPDSRGYFSKQTLQWLENVLEENKDKHILLFQHFPVVEPAQESLYECFHKIRNKKAYLRVVKKYSNVVLISSGHYHRAGEFEKYGMKHFSTPALFITPSYYRVTKIDYESDTINNITTELVEN